MGIRATIKLLLHWRIGKRQPSPAFRRMLFGLCNAPATFKICMMAIFSDMVEEIIEVFMDDFSVFKNSFDHCLHNLAKVLQRCEEKNFVLN